MGCRSCGGGSGNISHEVVFPNGTKRVYLTEVEAREIAIAENATYSPVMR